MYLDQIVNDAVKQLIYLTVTILPQQDKKVKYYVLSQAP